MSLANKYISRILLVVFGYVLTPGALIHEFHHHEETRCIPSATSTIGILHTHCRLLHIDAQVFSSPDILGLVIVPGISSSVPLTATTSPSLANVRFIHLRAPPLG
ncbi:MAG: hypothetical protein ACOYNC_01620 [Bacteroidales bacterium]